MRCYRRSAQREHPAMSVNIWTLGAFPRADKGDRKPQPRIGILPAMIVGLVAFMGTSSLLGFMVNIADQASLAIHVGQTRDVRGLQTALADAETDVRSYVAT